MHIWSLKLVAQILSTKFGFVSDWWQQSCHWLETCDVMSAHWTWNLPKIVIITNFGWNQWRKLHQNNISIAVPFWSWGVGQYHSSWCSDEFCLTHLTLDKMAAILADDNFKCNFLNENDRILIQISLKFVTRSRIDNKPALVQVMAWRRRGDKPLPEPVLT